MLAKEIAAHDYCLYLFKGMRSNFEELHITSTNFEEPRALEFVSQCITSVAIHGRRDEGDPSTIWLGGLNAELVTVIESRLREQGFIVSSRGHRFAATNPRNICNRTRSGRGVQIEVPKTLRQTMRSGAVLRKRFVRAVRESMRTLARPIQSTSRAAN